MSVSTGSTSGGASTPPTNREAMLAKLADLDEQHAVAVAGGELAACVVARDVLLAAPGHRDRVLGVEVGELLQHRLAVRRHFSTTAFIRSSVVRMPLRFVRRRSGPSTSL